MAIKGYVIRGLLSVWITRGPEKMLAYLNKIPGVELEIEDHGTFLTQFSHLGPITKQLRQWKLQNHKIAIIGHSFGGSVAIWANNNLSNMDIGVDLLCPIDPAGQYPCVVNDTGQQVVGFFQKQPGQLGQGVDTAGRGWTQQEWKDRVKQYQRYESHIAIINDPFVWGKIHDKLVELTKS
jgi:pimeloyl-ACP methyl ester carboxylesterase